jgi:hypothetical protein
LGLASWLASQKGLAISKFFVLEGWANTVVEPETLDDITLFA